MHKGDKDKDKDKDMGKDKKAGCLACKGNKKEKRRYVHFDFVSSPTGALYIIIIAHQVIKCLQHIASKALFLWHSAFQSTSGTLLNILYVH